MHDAEARSPIRGGLPEQKEGAVAFRRTPTRYRPRDTSASTSTKLRALVCRISPEPPAISIVSGFALPSTYVSTANPHAEEEEDLPSRAARRLVREGIKWTYFASILFLFQALAVFLENLAPLLAMGLTWPVAWDLVTFQSVLKTLSPFASCIDPTVLAGLSYKLRKGLIAREDSLVFYAHGSFVQYDPDLEGHVTLEEYNKKRRQQSNEALQGLSESQAMRELEGQFPVLFPLMKFFQRLSIVLFFLALPRFGLAVQAVMHAVA